MKILNLHIILTLLTSTIFLSCDENIPRDRPTFSTSATTTSPDTDTTTDTTTTANLRENLNGAIIINSNHCACSAGKPISIGNCEAICQEKSSSTDTTKKFFFEVDLTTAFTQSVFTDVASFCTTQDGENQQAACNIEVKDESGTIVSNLDFSRSSGQTAFNATVTSLNENQTYRLSIVEESSQIRSTTVQLRLTSDLIEDNVGGPLALMPVNQYSCLFRTGSIDQSSGELIVNDVNRFHFYFIPETRPEPLQQSSLPSVNCYDIETYGTTPINSPLLEEKTGAYTLWNRNDPRFFDLDNDDKLQVHNLLEQNMNLQGQTFAETPKFFFELQWPNGFDDGETNPSDQDATTSLEVENGKLGFYMTPFLDSDTFKAYCPKQEHYFSDSVVFRAMREIVAVDTEGLYAAKQDNVCDFILVKESLLKQIWFYIEGGAHIQPTDATIAGQKIQFYWPADTASPYIKKSHQRVYTIKTAEEISCGNTPTPESGGSGSDGVRTSFPPHDKRIGCIPMLAD